MEPFADNFVPVIAGNILHPDDKPFCYDPACPCHVDAGEIANLVYHVEQGHLTPEEATAIAAGKTI